jgi:hypothetical protein
MSYLPGCTFPRRLSPTKLIFILIVSIVIAIQLIIVNDIEDWNRNSPRDASRYILPLKNTTIILPRKLKDHDDSLDILLVVTSEPKNTEQRQSIRNHWKIGQKEIKSFNFTLIFLLGLTRDSQVDSQ